MIPEPEISEYPEHEVKSKIGNIFVNKKILEEYSVKIYETDPYFYEHYGKKYKLMKMSVSMYYLEWCLFYWISLSRRNWWKRSYRQRSYFWGEKTRSTITKTWL